MKPLSVAVLLLVTACQPQARRLLLLDLNLGDPAAVAATAEPWDAAGYTVEYRRFYPHLTRHDLARYRVLLLLGGRTPETPSDAIGLGDLALLSEWVPHGGVLVFGYAGDGEGYFDRWVMNRWLASVGVGITIGDYPLRDSIRSGADPVPDGALRESGIEPFPAGRNHVLLVHEDGQTLARVPRTAFVRPPGQPPAARPRAAVLAANRVGDGLVVIASRHALGALGPDFRASPPPAPDSAALARTRRFLVGLARWTRRPAEWALLPQAGWPANLSLLAAPRPVPPRTPRLTPPGGTSVVRLPDRSGSEDAGRAATPGWIQRQGMRVLGTRDPGAGPALDSLVAFLQTGAFNALWTTTDASAADSLASAVFPRQRARATLQPLAERLQETSVLWIPGFAIRDLPSPGDVRERGIAGDTLPAWCALDARFWDQALAPAYLALARLAARRPDLIAGIALDLELPGRGATGGYTMGYGFCDGSWQAGVRGLQRDSAWINRFAALPVAARYDAVLESGDLAAYYEALENAVAARAGELRAAVRRLRPDVLFVFRSTAPPADWFTLGLLRGFSEADAPLLLWTREPRVRARRERYRAQGINLVHAVGLAPGGMTARDWTQSRRAVFGESDGFWISATDARGPAATDSLARLIRLLVKER